MESRRSVIGKYQIFNHVIKCQKSKKLLGLYSKVSILNVYSNGKTAIPDKIALKVTT